MTANSYARRIHRVTDHIRGHLGEDLSLPTLAAVAGFSPYHFHRIFKALTDETVASFTRRARLERAVFLMRGAPDRELGSVAMDAGFGSQSDFSRVFRRTYGIAPSQWDRRGRLDGRLDFAAEAQQRGAGWSPPPVRVVERPACRVAYVRVRDPWSGPRNLAEGYARLTARLDERGVPWRRASLLGLSWDSEKATPLERLVYDLGITVGPAFRAEGEFGVHELPAVRAAEIHCQSLLHVALAWEHLYAQWLPGSGYEPAHVPAIKRFRSTPEVFDQAAWDLDCSIALRPQGP